MATNTNINLLGFIFKIDELVQELGNQYFSDHSPSGTIVLFNKL